MEAVVICGLGFFVFAFLIRIPISFAVGMSAVLYCLVTDRIPIEALTHRMVMATESWPIMAVPFFVLMGIALNRGRSGNYLMDLANSLVGWFYGGLSAVMIVVNMFFGGCSGSAVADASSIGGVMIPEMVRKGYGKGYSAALNAASSTIGIIIPPSIPLILYAWVTEVSIRKLFLAGVIPGILVGVVQMLAAGYLGYRRKHYRAPRPVMAVVWPQFIRAVPALFIPIIVMGGILAGVYTTTEAALMGALYVIGVEILYYKAFGFKDLFGMMVEAAKVSGVVIMLIATSLMLTYVIVLSRVPMALQESLTTYIPNGHLALIVIALILLVTGCFLDLTPSLLIFTPIFFPFATKLGVDPVQLGVVTTMVLGIGLFTPPVGQTLYISALVAKAPIEVVSEDILWFLAAIAAVVLLVIFHEPATLWLAGV
ncbi:MAG: TRAP transporter large permease [Syntrophobacteraceae bacterium]